jgi:capsular polysaccharide transport system permease protein
MKHTYFKWFMIVLFVLGTVYTLFFQSKKYTSIGTVMVQDLSQEQSISMLGALLTSSPQAGAKDSLVADIYIRSYDMYRRLDSEFNLTRYYTGDRLDFLQRLYPGSPLPFFEANGDNLLKRYDWDLLIVYDPASSTLQLGYRHTDPKTAQKVVRSIIRHTFDALNRFERENGKIVLEFLTKEAQIKRKAFMESIKKVIAYQNEHNMIDPNVNIQLNSTLLAQLESELIQNEVSYRSQLVHKPSSAPSMQILAKSINQIKQKIRQINERLAGKDRNETLNVDAFHFEVLKNESRLAQELYKQTLIKLEEARVNAKKSAKNLTIVTQPTLPELYDSPKRFQQILSLLLILGFVYGIVTLIVSILESHRD